MGKISSPDWAMDIVLKSRHIDHFIMYYLRLNSKW